MSRKIKPEEEPQFIQDAWIIESKVRYDEHGSHGKCYWRHDQWVLLKDAQRFEHASDADKIAQGMETRFKARVVKRMVNRGASDFLWVSRDHLRTRG